jgi:hypothetical protein
MNPLPKPPAVLASVVGGLVICDSIFILSAIVVSWIGDREITFAGGIWAAAVFLLAIGLLVTIPRINSFNKRWADRESCNTPSMRLAKIAIGIGFGGLVQSFASIATGSGRFGSQSVATWHCRWPLVSHLVVTCVNHAAYLQAGADLQRFLLGIVLFILMVELACGLGTSFFLNKQRRTLDGW